MLKNPAVRNLVLIWLAWSVILVLFQNLVDLRYEPSRPDYALEWTPGWTGRNSPKDVPYLIEPFMNQQVSMDSEYYLSIATAGYDDPVGRRTEDRQKMPLNYAFFPLYPYAIAVVSAPLRLFGLNPIATSTLAGVLVSLLGTLGGMLALYDLTRDELGEDGATRTAFYLLIFPSAFFLAQVFTEGLFIGLSFGCLALLRRKQLLWASVLALLATWTRAVGAGLIIPLALAWLQQDLGVRVPFIHHEPIGERKLTFVTWAKGLLILSPVLAYVIWRAAFGANFTHVEEEWFGRGLLDFRRFFEGVKIAWEAIQYGGNTQMATYYLMEFVSLILALVACVFTFRRYPGAAIFGLIALMIPATSGWPQSLIRYVMAVPGLFIYLSRLGRNPVFDRAWTFGSLLVFGMLTTLFTWDMWVA
jgi:hypothetical protein